MSRESLSKAVQLAGGQVHLARMIKALRPGSKVSQVHVWGWLNDVQMEVPPADSVLAIAESLAWRVTPHELRADLYPNPTDALPAEIAVLVATGRWPERDGSEPAADAKKAA